MASGTPARQLLTALRRPLKSKTRHHPCAGTSATSWTPSQSSSLPSIPSRSISSPGYLPSETGERRSRPANTDFQSQHHLATNTAPRWAQTPEGMSMPVRARAKKANEDWVCNESPEKLDELYRKMLGPEGPSMLSDETKWLAVTHKSFDQGKRGFNERLAFMGRRIVELQASLALLGQPVSPLSKSLAEKDVFGRLPFAHPVTNGLENLSATAKDGLLNHKRISQVGEIYGISRLMRWRPRRGDNLVHSGLEVAVAQTLYAIVGAVALERGGLAANRLVKEKILTPLGLTSTSR